MLRRHRLQIKHMLKFIRQFLNNHTRQYYKLEKAFAVTVSYGHTRLTNFNCRLWSANIQIDSSTAKLSKLHKATKVSRNSFDC